MSLADETAEALKRFADFCEAHDPADVARVFPERRDFEFERFFARIAVVADWLNLVERGIWIDQLLAETGGSHRDCIRRGV
jgi:hypothetical protein